MKTNRGFASLAAATAMTGLTALTGTFAAPIAHADPLLDGIASVVKGDRFKYAPTCPAYAYNGNLQAVAQAYARRPRMSFVESPISLDSGTYNGRVISYNGVGGRQDAALTNAYENGAGRQLSDCAFTELGVGFFRAEGDNGYDLVTISFGQPAAPAPAPVSPPVAPVPPPANSKPVVPMGHLHQATATDDVDVYDNPNGDGKPIRGLIRHEIVTVKVPCTPEAFCELDDGSFVWGEFLKNN